MNDKQARMIQELFEAGKTALASILTRAMGQMAGIAVDELNGSETVRNKVMADVIADYTENISKGGSMCVERVLKASGDGYLATTELRFVPWLDDKTDAEAKELLQSIYDMETAGVHPKDIARTIRDQLDKDRHNAMTVARTEASKIRNDARSRMFIENGYRYVQYITAGDDKVRPEHELRNGKIYRHEDAPFIGEYNCRCLLAPADYQVRRGAAVTENQAEYLTKEEVEL